MSENCTVSAKDVAAKLSLTVRRIQQLSEEGQLPPLNRGFFDVLPLIESLVPFLKGKATTRAELDAEKLRKTTLEADALQRAKDVDEGDLIPAPVMTSLIDEHFAAIRAEFEKDYQTTIPATCEGKKSGEIRRTTDRLFAERCKNLSTRKAKCLERVKSDS